jgi:DNA-binding MarR family transcriptional regulator
MSLDLSASQALALWHGITVDILRMQGPDLSTRQIAVLLTVYLEDRPHTVRELSSGLQISKPAITRALDRLCEDGLLRRKTDDKDRRSVLIQRTVKGSVFLSEIGDAIQRAADSNPNISAPAS